MAQEEPNVGQRIRLIREQRGLSLRALAKRCGLSINAISLIERGENSPTVSSLQLLAKALELPITDFFQEEHEQVMVFVTPAQRLRSEANGITIESLGIGLSNQQLEPFLIVVEPGAGNIDQPITHPGEEFVYCLKGEIVYCIGDQLLQLEPGYSLLFEASQPHCFCNAMDIPALMIAIFYTGEASYLAQRWHLEAQSSMPSMPAEEVNSEDCNGPDSQ
jgi:transcriptional regulator with XRE-family HTH domain